MGSLEGHVSIGEGFDRVRVRHDGCERVHPVGHCRGNFDPQHPAREAPRRRVAGSCPASPRERRRDGGDAPRGPMVSSWEYGDGHLVLEDLEEPRHLLVGVVGIDGDLLDEPGERLHHGGTVLPRQDAVTNVLGLERPLLWGRGPPTRRPSSASPEAYKLLI